MALKDLLVYVDQSAHAAERLRLAADLARRHQSRLTALYVRELSPAQRHEQSIAELGQGSAEAITRSKMPGATTNLRSNGVALRVSHRLWCRNMRVLPIFAF
jgi:nucleotide-binding universal stress UspA family protein